MLCNTINAVCNTHVESDARMLRYDMLSLIGYCDINGYINGCFL